LETLAENEVIPLAGCEHVFHAECIKQFIQSQVDDSKFPIVCPEAKCKQTLNDLDIKDLLDYKAFNKFTQFQIKNALEVQKDVSWCPTPDCKFAFVFDEEDKKNNFELNCPMCKKHYCLNCRTIFHVGMTCQEYFVDSKVEKDDTVFLNFAKGMRFKQCPSC
jgi:ariadne-1